MIPAPSLILLGLNSTRPMLWFSPAPALKDNVPPPIQREFRAAWVATVDNIDWPSKRTLTTEQQQREMIQLLDAAVGMRLNAIILQVRPSADALYPSKLEPWSEYLTGKQGQAPNPYCDPLKFAIDEAHKRGLQLHCWINPYRAESPAQKGPLSSTHIAKTNPSLVKQYGSFLWMDPGEPKVQKRTLDVVRDLVHRYDLDGIHIDDYFYPYPEGGKDFPDDRSYAKYVKQGGKLDRPNWRRHNVDTLVHSMYATIKREKRWVLFGISPFGIYRPGIPEGIHSGVDQYAELYADAKRWLNEGWCDYFTPQLYWAISAKAQSYPVLLNWWVSENLKNRHLWPGNYTGRTSPKSSNWKPKEILDQIEVTRSTLGATGNVHFSMDSFLKNFNGVADAIRGGAYGETALVPESKWLSSGTPAAPVITSFEGNAISWKPKGKEHPMWFAIWAKYGQLWRKFVVPATQTRMEFEPELPAGKLEKVAVAAVSRLGVMSPCAEPQFETGKSR